MKLSSNLHAYQVSSPDEEWRSNFREYYLRLFVIVFYFYWCSSNLLTVACRGSFTNRSKGRKMSRCEIKGGGGGGKALSASTISGKKTGIQTRIKMIAPHAFFVHCHCHLLLLACVKAGNSTNGIKPCVCYLDSSMEVRPLFSREQSPSKRSNNCFNYQSWRFPTNPLAGTWEMFESYQSKL